MDNKTLSMEVFLKSLTEDQADTCESDEKQLAAIFSAGWSEATAVLFHRTMLHVRRINPDATVEVIFEAAFRPGLIACVVEPYVDKALKLTRKKRGVRGV